MDRSSYEKLSIRESAASLKKYGSTSRHISRNEYFRKHYVENTDTLQGIALKYNVTIEQIRRSNKLWASDSLFLREFLLIPSKEPGSEEKAPSNPEPDVVSPSTSSVNNDDDDNIDNFLNKIDAAIATTKEEVKKTTRNSKFSINSESSSERRQPAVSRMKQAVNNLGDDNCHQPHAIVVQQGKKVRTSLRHHEEQQDELFQL